MLTTLLGWLRYRFTFRCLVCGRLHALHTPWQEYRCNRTPLPIVLTDQGLHRAMDEPASYQPPASVHAAGQ